MQTDIITSFAGKYRFLSNFWRVPIIYDGHTYPSVEHAYQAAKIPPTILNYHDLCHGIRTAPTPGRAKRLGRFAPLRDDWDEIKRSIMVELINRKFHYSHLAGCLIATAPATLVEGNTWNDRYWGVSGGFGANHLGNILMEVRSKLMKQSS